MFADAKSYVEHVVKVTDHKLTIKTEVEVSTDVEGLD